MWQNMINYNPQKEMFIDVTGPRGNAQGVNFKLVLAG